MKISKTSVALLLIQLAIVSTVAAKYLYQRWTCPRVWTRTVAFDPELPMRGRYLSLQLVVDGCQSTLPSAKAAEFPRDINGVGGSGGVRAASSGNFSRRLEGGEQSADGRLHSRRSERDARAGGVCAAGCGL